MLKVAEHIALIVTKAIFFQTQILQHHSMRRVLKPVEGHANVSKPKIIIIIQHYNIIHFNTYLSKEQNRFFNLIIENKIFNFSNKHNN